MSQHERDIDAIATWENDCEDWDERRATGPRREPPTICYSCGREMSEAETLVRGSFCSGQCEADAEGRSQR